MNSSSLPPVHTPGPEKRRPKLRLATPITAGFGIFLIVVGLIAGGVGSALIMAALFALITGLYTWLTGRPSWARLASRKMGAVTVAIALVALIAGSIITLPLAEDVVETAAAEQSKAAVSAETETAVAEETKTATPAPSSTPKPKIATSPKPTPKSTPIPAPTPDLAPVDDVELTEVTGQASAPEGQPENGTSALALLDTLSIKGRAPKTDYDRDQFGRAWTDVDGNGCDTRNDILNRDLTQIGYTNSVPCKVQTGVLADPYTGAIIPFLRGQGTSSDVQIDHVVALADAWQKGAQQLSVGERLALANDPLNLLATDGPTNAQKGAGDAATWLPPNKGFRCEYVARQISVKATYNLWVTQAEHDAMARVLASCADVLVPTNQSAPEAEPRVESEPAPAPVAPAPAPAPVVPAPAQEPPPVAPVAPVPAAPAPGAPFKNCTAARAAGAAPVYVGQPGYGTHLDRDGDGVGCES